jgi:hypothetical protein
VIVLKRDPSCVGMTKGRGVMIAGRLLMQLWIASRLTMTGKRYYRLKKGSNVEYRLLVRSESILAKSCSDDACGV